MGGPAGGQPSLGHFRVSGPADCRPGTGRTCRPSGSGSSGPGPARPADDDVPGQPRIDAGGPAGDAAFGGRREGGRGRHRAIRFSRNFGAVRAAIPNMVVPRPWSAHPRAGPSSPTEDAPVPRTLRPLILTVGLFGACRRRPVPGRAGETGEGGQGRQGRRKASEPKDNVHVIRPQGHSNGAGAVLPRFRRAPGPARRRRQAAGEHVLRRLHAGGQCRVEDRSTRPGRSRSASTAAPGRRRSGCTSGHSGRRRSSCPTTASRRPRPTRSVDNEFTLLDADRSGVHRPGLHRLQPGRPPASTRSGFTASRRTSSRSATSSGSTSTRYGRWESPKFVAGESYGTTRAAGLSGYLQDRHGMYLNGIVLVSSVLNLMTIRLRRGQRPALCACTCRPTRRRPGTTRSCQHDLQSGSLSDVVGQARQFAESEYQHALTEGDRLSEDKRQDIARKVSRFTGLSEDYVRRSNLRIEHPAVLQGIAARPAADRRPV